MNSYVLKVGYSIVTFLTLAVACVGQDFGGLQLPDELGAGFGFGGDTEEQVALTADFEVDPETRIADVSLRATVTTGWHIYSLTQKAGGPIPSEVKLKVPSTAALIEPWECTTDPETHIEEIFDNLEVEEHRGSVVWKSKYQLPADYDFEAEGLKIDYSGQACTDGLGQCVDVIEEVSAIFVGFAASEPSVTEYVPFSGHVKFRGSISPGQAKPGDRVKLEIVSQPLEGYHVYAFGTEKRPITSPTLIALTKRNGWSAASPVASVEPKREETGIEKEPVMEIHEGQVSWQIEIAIPDDAEEGKYKFEGLVGFQTCNESSCDLPEAFAFQGELTLVRENPNTESVMLTLEPYEVVDGDAYASVAELAEKMKWGLDGAPVSEPITSVQLVSWMFTAFLAGLILNVMPCVLPVIGLKILSLVSQAGSQRFQIFFLNLWLGVGVLFVFVVLATMAVFFGLAWGDQFNNHWFTMGMISVVFIFGLSFLGVWEVPIPGFAATSEASKLSEREGAIGAFFKGVLSTLLATPCAGPLLVPAVTWAVTQPASITYTMFVAMGLGMASPYLIIGMFPAAIKFLPKPGNWMVTFKELMGFVMLGTSAWLFYTLSADYRVTMAAFAVFLGFFCWWIGRIPAGSEKLQTVKGWGLASAILAFGGWLSLSLFGPGESEFELEWQPFDRVAIQDEVDRGATVFVDFTADS
ncbi:MAG: cytochrome c biogenesis protein CcdA [Planctomycetota bacterium]|nr:cytochrome c biogenesis protein CcdA [Planctomycetota bacterium]